MASSLNPLCHPGQLVANGAQSATHSQTFPTMSRTPAPDTQSPVLPVLTGPLELVLQVVVALPARPGSGVPNAAICHSAFVSSRFPTLWHACWAWNQET